MNIYDFAITMEDDGHKYYMSLASSSQLPGLVAIFTSMAEDELKHAEFFRALKLAQQPADLPESKALGTAQNLFTLRLQGTEELKNVADSLAAYRHAMKLEADSFRFYEEAANQEADARVKELLLQIAREEHEHFNILENVYHFVNAPNQSIEWSEFSNLGEFRQFGREIDS